MNKLNPFSGRTKNRSWFWWGIKLGAVLAIAIWWWFENLPGEREKSKIIFRQWAQPEGTSDNQITIDHEKAGEPIETTVEQDDLRAIEGLGPKSEQVLTKAGVLTFADLGGMSPEEIHDLLTAGGVRISIPETWPEQAALAAAGEWKKLKTMQDGLVGGRRV